MAVNITDIIAKAVSSSTDNIDIPSNVKDKVLGGLSDSILGSLTQTAAKAGGIEQITSLLTGKASAAASPITALAGNLFSNNILKNLNLGSAASSALTGIIPTIMGKLGGLFKDQDGDGDVDIQDIILSIKNSGVAGKVIGAAVVGGVLGKIFKKK